MPVSRLDDLAGRSAGASTGSTDAAAMPSPLIHIPVPAIARYTGILWDNNVAFVVRQISISAA
jgi:hypothetical protein